ADARPDLLGPLAFVHQPAAFLARRGEASEGTPAVPRLADPVDLRIVPDDRMLRVHEDDLVILVHPVFADPVRVEDFHVRIVPRGPFLGDALDRLRHRDFAEPAAFRTTPAATPDPRADDSISLLRPVA